MSDCHKNLTFFFEYRLGTEYANDFGRIEIILQTYKLIKKMGKLNIKPLADRVIIEPAAAEVKTAGGIIIPNTAKEKPQKGIVLAVGPGKKDEPMTVKVGDNVLYGKYSGTEIVVEGKDYLIMRESDIVAIV